MIASVLRIGFLSFLAVIAVGCTPEPSAPKAASNVLLEARQAFRLDVTSVSVNSSYVSPGRAPNVEHMQRVTPVTVAERWAQTRLVAVGQRGEAVLTVLDGSVVSEDLPKKGGLTGFFGDQLDTRLKARLKARLVIERPGTLAGDFGRWEADVEANAERTILESASLNERDAAYAALMQALTENFDRALTEEVNRSMRPVLR